MIPLEKWMILTPLQKFTKNVGDLVKIIVAKCFEWLPKVQKIAQSGHTDEELSQIFNIFYVFFLSFFLFLPIMSTSLE